MEGKDPKPNKLLVGSQKLNSEVQLIRGYLINEIRTVQETPSNQVVANSPEKVKANGNKESALAQKLNSLAKSHATKQKVKPSSDARASKTLSFADAPFSRQRSHASSTAHVSTKSTTRGVNNLDMKRAHYRHDNTDQPFVGFVDASDAVAARRKLKSKLRIDAKSNETGSGTADQQASKSGGGAAPQKSLFTITPAPMSARSTPQPHHSSPTLLRTSLSVGVATSNSVAPSSSSSCMRSSTAVKKAINPFGTTLSSSSSSAVSSDLLHKENMNERELPQSLPHSPSLPRQSQSQSYAHTLPGFTEPQHKEPHHPQSSVADPICSLSSVKEPGVREDDRDNIDKIIEDLKRQDQPSSSSSLTVCCVQNKPTGRGDVSNNFVRANQNKKGLFIQKGGKNKAEKLRKGKKLELRKALDVSNNVHMDCEQNTLQDSSGEASLYQLEGSGAATKSSGANSFGGLSAIGLDAVQLALDALNKSARAVNEKKKTTASKEKRRNEVITGGASSNSNIQPKKGGPQHISPGGSPGTKDNLVSSSAFLSNLQKKFGNRHTPARGTLRPSAAFGKQAAAKTRERGRSMQCTDEFIQASEASPPLCAGHHMPATLLTVKKAGGNKGRKFFGCSFPSEQRCKFFLWVEDNPNVIDIISTARIEQSCLPESGVNSEEAPESPIEVWIRFALEAYKHKLEDFDVMELKAEISQCNHRVQLARRHGYDQYVQVAPQGGEGVLTLSGRRGDLMDKVLQAAFSQLCVSCGFYVAEESKALKVSLGCGGGNKGKKKTVKKRNISEMILSPTESESESESELDDGDGGDTCDDSFGSDADDAGSGGDNADCDEEAEFDMAALMTKGCVAAPALEVPLLTEPCSPIMMELSSDSDDDDDDDDHSDEENGDTTDQVRARHSHHARNSPRMTSNSGCFDILTGKEDEEGGAKDTPASAALPPVATPVTLEDIQKSLRCTFGHEVLREGQLWAVQRVLDRKRSLLVLPTGAGKSLTYLLPSVLMNKNTACQAGTAASERGQCGGSLTLVVSPLISLMQDQMRKLPVELPGGCFSGGLTSVEAAMLTEAVLKGQIKVLFVSPERLCMPSFRQLMSTLQNERTWRNVGGRLVQVGGVGLLCVDEAHCLSQWSFNFRPSFLRIRKELQYIQPEAVLALTATAPGHVQREIMEHLSIPAEGVLAFPPRRPNLMLHARIVTDDEERRQQVVDEIFGKHDEGIGRSSRCTSVDRGRESDDEGMDDEVEQGGMFDFILSKMSDKRRKVSRNAHTFSTGATKAYSSLPTIVYVWRRDEAESLADYLKSQEVSAAAYHAGMERSQRARVQLMFNKGTVNVVVATVAFGMGIDKSNVRRVIHASLPKSVENYVQEVGRAGRDGDPAKCTLLLSREDVTRQHSLSHSQSLGTLQILSLLRRIFIPKKNSAGALVGEAIQFESEVAISLDRTAQESDVAGSMAETLLSVLELEPFNLCLVDGVRYDTLKGRIQSEPAASLEKVSGSSLFPLILKEICRLNTLSTTTDPSPPLSMPLAGPDENDLVPPSRGDGRNYDIALAYAGGLEFELSLLALAQAVHVRPDKLSRMLWGMQCRGILSYNLSGSAIYVTVKANERNIPKEKSLHCSCLDCWLLSLSKNVNAHVSRISEEASGRILDIWRMGSIIESLKLEGRKNRSVADKKANEQEVVMGFLCHYMDDMANAGASDDELQGISSLPSSTSQCTTEISAEIFRQKQGTSATRYEVDALVDLEKCFHAIELPMIEDFRPDDENTPNKEVARFQQCQRQCRQLSQDPNLLAVVSGLYTAAVAPCVSPGGEARESGVPSITRASTRGSACHLSRSREMEMKRARREYFSMVIAKILHGLGSTLLPSADWRERCSSQWESCRDLSFNAVYACALSSFDAGGSHGSLGDLHTG